MPKKGEYNTQETKEKIRQSLKGIKHSEERKKKYRKPKSKKHRENMSKAWKGKIGDKASGWKGDNVGVMGIHIWLRKTYIKPKKCEFCEVKGKYTGTKVKHWSIDYALKRGFEYKRKREHFLTLCRKCHKIYDIGHKHKY